MLADKAMLIAVHISLWGARKFDRQVSDEVAQTHEASSKAGRYNKHLLAEAEKLEELRGLASQIRLWFYKMTLPWSDEGFRLLPSESYFEFTQQFSEFKVTFDQLVREFIDAYPGYCEKARPILGGLHRDSDYPDIEELLAKFDLRTDIVPIPCGEDFRVSLGQEEKVRVAREIDQQVKQSVSRGMGELWSRLKESVVRLAAQLERPKARLHSATLRNLLEVAEIVPRLNVTNDDELTNLANETQARLASFSRQELAQSGAVRARAAGIANELAVRIKCAMKARGYDVSDKTADSPLDKVFPSGVVQMPEVSQQSDQPQPETATPADAIVSKMADYYMELIA
jgi:hypothetical protein